MKKVLDTYADNAARRDLQAKDKRRRRYARKSAEYLKKNPCTKCVS